MGNLPQQQQSILELWVVSLVYGVYVVVFAASIYVLISRKRYTAVDKYLLVITITLFLISTTQNILVFLNAFLTTDIWANQSYQGETQQVLNEKILADLIDCIEYGLTASHILLADALLIWRCFVVWGRRYMVIVIPIILLLTGTVCGYIRTALGVKMYLIRLHNPLSAPTPLPGWNQALNLYACMNTVFYTTSFVTNVSMSLLIACRIWWITRGTEQYFGKRHRRKYTRIASIIIESGVLYSACLLLIAIFSSPMFNQGTAYVVIMGIAYEIVGIFPTMIIVLVGLGKTADRTILTTTGTIDIWHVSRNPNETIRPNMDHGHDSDEQMRTRSSDLQAIDISARDIECKEQNYDLALVEVGNDGNC